MAELSVTELVDRIRSWAGNEGKYAEVADWIEKEFSGEALEVISDGRYIRGRFVVFVGVLSAVGGFAAGGFFIDRRLRKQYERIAEEEIDQMRDHFRARLFAKDEKPNLDELAKVVKEENYSSNADEPAPPGEPNAPAVPEEVRNVFEDQKPEDDWDWEAEKQLRDAQPERPFVIHIDEKGENDYDETTLTYYAGDDVLCSSDDTVIDNPDGIVGVINLDKFGHGSNDRNIVYVRNNNLAIDIEVVRSDKTYAEEVHGFKHEETPRRRRPRQDE